MRRSCLVLVLLVVIGALFLQAGCQQQAKVTEEPAVATAPKEGEPKVTFENTVYDFGKVGPGRKLLGEFKFTNTGDTTLNITKVEKCCGAVTQLDKTEYEPGEKGVLKVTYNSRRTAGKINKKLYINSNDKENPRVMLAIQAETVLRVDYEPKRIKMLLKDENAGCPEIKLISVDNKPFSISSFYASGDSLTADFDSSVQATKFVLQPRADIEKLQKRYSGLIKIDLSFPEPDAESETLTIMFQALSRFTLRPSMLIVMYSEPNEPVEKTLWLTNNYGEAFEVESTASKEGIIEVLSQQKVGTRYKFMLQIATPGEDVKRFTDTFTINLKGGEKLEVPCRGIYRAPKTQRTGN